MEISDKVYRTVPEESKRFIKEFFLNCPKQLESAINIVNFAVGQPLMTTYESCTYVYILLKGRLHAIEERVSDTPYHFTELMPIEIVGDYELFTGVKGRYVTVAAAEPSLLLAIQAGPYLSWIRQDANALFLRIKTLMKQVTDQGLYERQKFILDNRARFLSFLVLECRKSSGKPFPLLLKYNREEISSMAGCSVRTANRMIKRLTEEGMLEICRGKLYIKEEHYHKILNNIPPST